MALCPRQSVGGGWQAKRGDVLSTHVKRCVQTRRVGACGPFVRGAWKEKLPSRLHLYGNNSAPPPAFLDKTLFVICAAPATTNAPASHVFTTEAYDIIYVMYVVHQTKKHEIKTPPNVALEGRL